MQRGEHRVSLKLDACCGLRVLGALGGSTEATSLKLEAGGAVAAGSAHELQRGGH
jgi:hypothetical protein